MAVTQHRSLVARMVALFAKHSPYCLPRCNTGPENIRTKSMLLAWIRHKPVFVDSIVHPIQKSFCVCPDYFALMPSWPFLLGMAARILTFNMAGSSQNGREIENNRASVMPAASLSAVESRETPCNCRLGAHCPLPTQSRSKLDSLAPRVVCPFVCHRRRTDAGLRYQDSPANSRLPP